MLQKILIKLLPKVWEDGMKQVEKQNLITKALKQAYKNEKIRLVWKPFVIGVISFLSDGVDEAKSALTWKE